MEIGPWDFSPDFFYYMMHKNYSGAYQKVEWGGFLGIIPQLYHKFSEDKSNVKRVLPRREKAAGVDYFHLLEAEEMEEKFRALRNEEVKRAADRNVDLMYSIYKDDFVRMNEKLLEAFDFILKKSKSKLTKDVTQLSKQLNLINERISYIHKTGIGYELENAKREKAYQAAQKDLEALAARTMRLAIHAQILY